MARSKRRLLLPFGDRRGHSRATQPRPRTFIARLLLLVGILGALVVYALASTAGASQPHLHEGGTGALGVEGMTEKQLFSWETALLGRAHAAEHAELRREARLARGAGGGKGLSPSSPRHRPLQPQSM